MEENKLPKVAIFYAKYGDETYINYRFESPKPRIACGIAALSWDTEKIGKRIYKNLYKNKKILLGPCSPEMLESYWYKKADKEELEKIASYLTKKGIEIKLSDFDLVFEKFK